MAPPLIFLCFVIVIATIVVVGGLVAARLGLWVRETSTKPSPGETDGPDSVDAGATAAGSRADTDAAEASAAEIADSEGRESVYGGEAATDDRFSRRSESRRSERS
jgi:hypothetical protein